MTHQEQPSVDYLSLGGHGYSITVLVAMVTVPTSPTLRGVSLQTKLPAEYLQVLDLSWRKQSPREAKARGKA